MIGSGNPDMTAPEVNWEEPTAGMFSSSTGNLYEVSIQTGSPDGSDNQFETEITSLFGVIDDGIALKHELRVVVRSSSEGCEVQVPEFDIWESGDTYAEAIENLILFLVSDFAFLSSVADESLTQDGIDRLHAYRRIIV